MRKDNPGSDDQDEVVAFGRFARSFRLKGRQEAMPKFGNEDVILVESEESARRIIEEKGEAGVVVATSHVPGAYLTTDTRRRVIVDESPSPAQADVVGPPRTIQENWDSQYWKHRYLKHFALEELRERFIDVFLNLHVLTPEGKLGLRSPQDGHWVRKFSDLLREQEYLDRQFLRTNTIPPHRERIVATYPQVPRGAELSLTPGINDAGFWFKVGEERYLRSLLETGKLKVFGRKSYRKSSDPARRDYEGRITTHTPEGYRLTVQNEVDTYVFCMTKRIEPKLFYDFVGSDSCLVIRNPPVFAERWRRAVRKQLGGGGEFYDQPVLYIDPVLADPKEAGDLLFAKHFRYSYQREYRLTAAPIPNFANDWGRALEPIDVDLGPIADIAHLVIVK